MTKAETIAYAINKECCRYSLIEWCEDWGFTVDDFRRFIECGEKGFAEQEGGQDG